MQRKAMMTPHVDIIAPKASISEAVQHRRHLDIGLLTVCEGERLVGMLTDRVITVRAVAAGRDPRTPQGREVMTPSVVYGFDAQGVQDAACLLAQYQMHRFLVLNRRQQLVGMVALGDLAVYAGTQPVAAEVLAQVSEPGKAGRT